mmetsp:Transcript_16434/g.25520  ORF Transcript_16434/g.25520 Transcript_16434/m.25520 type:complete len:81 (+) Transcript_16434:1305-1547(+)
MPVHDMHLEDIKQLTIAEEGRYSTLSMQRNTNYFQVTLKRIVPDDLEYDHHHWEVYNSIGDMSDSGVSHQSSGNLKQVRL